MSNNVLVNPDTQAGESAAGVASTLVSGTDGDFIIPLRTDAAGILQVNLATPTISVTGINASVGTTAATPPVFATQVGGTDGVVLRELHFTPPSGVAPSTDPALIVTFSPNSPLPAGSNVIGTVTANVGTSGDLALDATLTDGSQKAQLTDGTNAVAVATGAAGAGSNALVVGLSPDSPLPAGSNALGSVTANIGTTNGLALNATLIDGSQHTKISNGGFDAVVKAGSTAAAAGDGALVVTLSPNSPLPTGTNSLGSVTATQATASNLNTRATQGPAAAASAPWSVQLSDGSAFYTGTKTGQLPTSLVSGRLDANVGAWMGSTSPTVGQKTMTSSLPVVIASNQTVLNVETEVQLDFDTSGEGQTQNLSMIGIALPTSSGAVIGGTSTNPLNVTMSGGFTANQGAPASISNAWPIKITDSSGTTAVVVTQGADGGANTDDTLSTSARTSGYNGSTWDRLRAGLTSVASSITGFLNVMPFAKYDTSPTTRTNGQSGPLQTDNVGNLLVSLDSSGVADLTANVLRVTQKPVIDTTYAWSRFQNLGANATLNVKSSAAQLFSVYVHNVSSSARYLQLFNTATVPASGATPVFTFLVPAGGVTVMDGAFFGPNGANFSTGLAFACSTTAKTYTAATASDHVTQIMYV